jgi:hypothetical protein
MHPNSHQWTKCQRRKTAPWAFRGAATGRRFYRLAGLPARQSRVQRLGKTPRPSPLDDDKSPAQSGENSPHSINYF